MSVDPWTVLISPMSREKEVTQVRLSNNSGPPGAGEFFFQIRFVPKTRFLVVLIKLNSLIKSLYELVAYWNCKINCSWAVIKTVTPLKLFIAKLPIICLKYDGFHFIILIISRASCWSLIHFEANAEFVLPCFTPVMKRHVIFLTSYCSFLLSQLRIQEWQVMNVNEEKSCEEQPVNGTVMLVCRYLYKEKLECLQVQ